MTVCNQDISALIYCRCLSKYTSSSFYIIPFPLNWMQQVASYKGHFIQCILWSCTRNQPINFSCQNDSCWDHVDR